MIRRDLEVKEAIGWQWFQVPRAQTTGAEADWGPEAVSEGPCPPCWWGQQGLAQSMTSDLLHSSAGLDPPSGTLLAACKVEPMGWQKRRGTFQVSARVLDTNSAQGTRGIGVISLLELLESVTWVRVKAIPTNPQVRPAGLGAAVAASLALGPPCLSDAAI